MDGSSRLQFAPQLSADANVGGNSSNYVAPNYVAPRDWPTAAREALMDTDAPAILIVDDNEDNR